MTVLQATRGQKVTITAVRHNQPFLFFTSQYSYLALYNFHVSHSSTNNYYNCGPLKATFDFRMQNPAYMPRVLATNMNGIPKTSIAEQILTISGLPRCDFCEIPVVISFHLQIEYFAFGITRFGDQVFV